MFWLNAFTHSVLRTSNSDLNMVRSADELQIGDFLIDKDHNLIEITSLIKTHGHFQVFKLDVEEADLYIANGIITHNDKPRGGL